MHHARLLVVVLATAAAVAAGAHPVAAEQGPSAPGPARPPTPDEPGATFSDCEGCPEMVVVPQGRFTMGSPAAATARDQDEFPAHPVTIPGPFAVGKYEVTRAQFDRFAEATGYRAAANCSVWTGARAERVAAADWRNPGITQTGAHPVVCLTWHDAQAYLAWLSQRTGHAYRLLTESEWEYAARAGASTDYAFGDDDAAQCRHGNVADESAREAGGLPTWTYAPCSDGVGITTAPVGSFAANAFGLHDMLGNVWEWVEDCYHGTYVGAPADGSAWVTEGCPARVDRGGAYYNNRGSNRVTERASYPATANSGNFGFRVARALK